MEPKKRGRPKGSGKKKVETSIQNTEMYLPGDLGTVNVAGDVRNITQVYKKNDGSVTLTIGAKEKYDHEEIEFPENWANLGKLERLKWLTAQKK